MTTKLKEILKGEPSQRSTIVVDDVVTTKHTVKPDEQSQSRYELTWSYNFDGVTHEELLVLAERPMRIRKQAAWRKAADRMDGDKWDNITVSVRDMLDNARQAADPVAKAARAGEKMDAKQRAALIAQLTAMDAEDETFENTRADLTK